VRASLARHSRNHHAANANPTRILAASELAQKYNISYLLVREAKNNNKYQPETLQEKL
jgi:hypothetical protein